MTASLKNCWFGPALCIIITPFLLGSGCPANLSGNLTGNTQGDQQNNDTGTQADRSGIYVTNFSGNSVTIYALDASGDATPKRTISGSSTGLLGPLGIARDTQRRVYVANRSGGKVTVYEPGAGGDATPVLNLTDPDMGSPEGLAIDTSDGVYVGNCPTLGGLGGITGVFHFTSNATTSDYKIAGANTGITVPVSLALDEARDLYVANAFGGTVGLFGPGQTGDQLPVQSFSPGGNTQSIAYGNAAVLLGTGGSGINQYPKTASGNAAASGNIGGIGYTGGIFFDTDVTPPVIYVADFSGNAIHIIQTVGVAPFLTAGTTTTIQGPSTGLENPYGVLVIKL